MNNNMPNNFNNGFPGATDKPVNNGPIGPNNAKEQLMGGQSAVGNGPSVMQGVGNVQNDRGIMQGNAMPNKPESPVMPGQGHSGINASTLQKEDIKPDASEVVSIPNFAPNIPEAPKPEPKPAPQPMPNINPGVNPMANINPNINIDKPVGVNPLSQPSSEPVVGPQPDVNKVEVQPEVKNESVGVSNLVMPNKPEEPKQEEKKPEINPAPNTLGQVNNQNLNSFPFNNMNATPNQPVNNAPSNPVGNAPAGNVVMDNPMPAPSNNMGAVPNQPMNNQPMNNQPVNKPSAVMGPNNMVNNGPSQIGKVPVDNDVVEMPNVSEKKFPLSIREMVLIGIAVVGIIAVIIVYWP